MITGGDLRQSRLDVGYKTFTISPCDTTTLSNYLDVQASGSNVVVSVYADGVSGGTADMTIVLEGQSADLTALQTYLLTQNGVIH